MSENILTTPSSFNNAEVVDFGKVLFVPSELPNMNLIIFKKGDIYQAICIDVEIDAVGGSLKEACENLRNTLRSYVKQMIYNYNGNKKAAIADIVNTAFSEGSLKSLLFSRYVHAKRQRIMSRIAHERKIKSKTEYLVLFWKMIFPFQPIHFNLAMAERIA